MGTRTFLAWHVVAVCLVMSLSLAPTKTQAATAAELDASSKAALAKLIETVPAAAEVNEKAVAVLVFPDVTKAGLIIGGQYGEGALLSGGTTKGYYETTAASFGLQIGGQTFGYAMFFMNDKALAYLDSSDGWDVGTAPTLVYGDEGWSSSASVSELEEDILVFFFDQEGLMAGAGIQGTKISRFTPE